MPGSSKPPAAKPASRSKLTEKAIAAFKPPPGRREALIFDTETRGLGLRAGVTGAKSFVCQWTDRATKRKHREVLGAWGAITLDQARQAARALLGKVAQGVNPATERAQARAADLTRRAAEADAKDAAKFTLDALITEWSELHLKSKRPSYIRDAPRALRAAFEPQLASPAASLTHKAVVTAIDGIAARGRRPLAGRTQAYGRACYGWAVKRRRLTANPFEGLPTVEGGNPTRERVLTDAEVGAIWRAAGTLGHPFGPVVRLMLLTAQRRDEVAGMAWSELSPDLSTWTLPGARAKNKKAHVVHLTEPARTILREAPRHDGIDLVFTTTGARPPSGFSKAKVALDTAIGREDPNLTHAEGWRFHDFRRTAVTWLAGAGFAPHVADRLLNHVGGAISGVAAIYQKGEFLTERKAALEAWATHVLRCAEGKVEDGKGNVVALRA